MKDENAMYVARTDPFGLAQEVSEMRSRGWEPVGGATAARNRVGEQVFIQLMTMPVAKSFCTITPGYLGATMVSEPTDAAKRAAAKPKEERTVADVLLLESSVFGCCDRHVNNSGCDCRKEAEARDATRKLLDTIHGPVSSEHPSCAPGSYAGPDHRELHKEEPGPVDVGRKAEQIRAERIRIADERREREDEYHAEMRASRAKLVALQKSCPHIGTGPTKSGTCHDCGGYV